MSKPCTFGEYIKTVGPELTLQLIEKSYRANRLAKIASGESKMVLYRIKHKYLSRAVDLKPDWFYVDSTTRAGNFIVLGVTSKVGFSFHIPEHRLLIRSHSKQILGKEI
jgi:hypothetical protein